jgi:uncharacterized membrane protein YjfL (UPF0719 family)
MNTITLATLTLLADVGFWDTRLGGYIESVLKAIGWAVGAGIGMGLGLIISLWIFTRLTTEIDEWALIKQNNIPIGIVLGCVVLGTSLVIALCAKPG